MFVAGGRNPAQSERRTGLIGVTIHLLFVCSRNQWRSPTAEAIYRNDPRVEVRSAGVRQSARHRINGRDLEWADLVLVMERSHAASIREAFTKLELPSMEVLDIPDDYGYMDPELIELIRVATEGFLQQFSK
tara:strand:- start:937 stop:1332 length:396 start_codon:yes stop_codon:yes gene_type:complete